MILNYKRFNESLSKYDIKYDVEDILIDLKDEGYSFSVTVSYDYKIYLFVKINGLNTFNGSYLKWKDIEEHILRINDLVSDKFSPIRIYYKTVEKDGRVFNRNDRDTIRWTEFIDETPKIGLYVSSEIKRKDIKEKGLLYFSIEYEEKTI